MRSEFFKLRARSHPTSLQDAGCSASLLIPVSEYTNCCAGAFSKGCQAIKFRGETEAGGGEKSPIAAAV